MNEVLNTRKAEAPDAGNLKGTKQPKTFCKCSMLTWHFAKILEVLLQRLQPFIHRQVAEAVHNHTLELRRQCIDVLHQILKTNC